MGETTANISANIQHGLEAEVHRKDSLHQSIKSPSSVHFFRGPNVDKADTTDKIKNYVRNMKQQQGEITKKCKP